MTPGSTTAVDDLLMKLIQDDRRVDAGAFRAELRVGGEPIARSHRKKRKRGWEYSWHTRPAADCGKLYCSAKWN